MAKGLDVPGMRIAARVQEGPLGMNLFPHGDLMADSGVPVPVVVKSLRAASAVSSFGIQPGDTIESLNGRAPIELVTYQRFLGALREERPIEIVFAHHSAPVTPQPAPHAGKISRAAVRSPAATSPIKVRLDALQAEERRLAEELAALRARHQEKVEQVLGAEQAWLAEQETRAEGEAGAAEDLRQQLPAADTVAPAAAAVVPAEGVRIIAARPWAWERGGEVGSGALAPTEIEEDITRPARTPPRSVDETTGPKVLTAKVPERQGQRTMTARASAQKAVEAPSPSSASSSLDQAQSALAEGVLSPTEFKHIASVTAAAARLEAEHVTKSTGRTNEEVAATDEEGRKHIDWAPVSSPGTPEVGARRMPAASSSSPRRALNRSQSLQASPHGLDPSFAASAKASPSRAVIANYFDPSAREAADTARRMRWKSELLHFISAREGRGQGDGGGGGDGGQHGDNSDDALFEKRAEEAFNGGVQECQLTTLVGALETLYGAAPPTWAAQLEELRTAWEPDLPEGAIVLPGDVVDSGAGAVAGLVVAQRGANALAQLRAFYFVFNRQKLDHFAAKDGDTLPRGSAAAVLLRAYGIVGLTPKLCGVYRCAPTGWEAMAARVVAERPAAAAAGGKLTPAPAAQATTSTDAGAAGRLKQKHQDERWARMEKFRGDMRLHQEKLLENAIIKWRRENPSGTQWEDYLKSECSGNIKTDKSGNTVWIDSRARQLEHTFKAVRAHTPLHTIGEPPIPPETDDIEKQEKEFAALFPDGGF